MSPNAVPPASRSISGTPAAHHGHGSSASTQAADRLELVAFEGRPDVAGRLRTRRTAPSAGPADRRPRHCGCPDFCERDHANE